MAANNVVEIIIRAVTTGTVQNIKKVETGLDRLNRVARETGQSLKTIGATAGIAATFLYAMAAALEAVAKRGEALGQRGLTKEWENLKAQGQELIDTLLTMQIAGTNTFDLLERFAGGLATSLKVIAILLETSAHGWNMFIIDMQRVIGLTAELTGNTTEWTKEWRNNAIAQEAVNYQLRIGLIWSEKLTESYEKLAQSGKAARQSNIRTGESLDSLIRKNKGLNDQYDKRLAREDAIRAGDARALASANAALAGGGGSGGGGGGRPNGPGSAANGGQGGSMGGTTPHVSIYIGDKEIKGLVREVVKDDVFKPAVKNGVGGNRKK